MSSGVSNRQGPHQVAQRFTSTTFPLKSPNVTFSPLMVFSFASRTVDGKLGSTAGAVLAGGLAGREVPAEVFGLPEFALRSLSSVELQLEIPKSAINESETRVKTTRIGVQKRMLPSCNFLFIFSAAFSG